jgi:hypothetical protein
MIVYFDRTPEGYIRRDNGEKLTVDEVLKYTHSIEGDEGWIDIEENDLWNV